MESQSATNNGLLPTATASQLNASSWLVGMRCPAGPPLGERPQQRTLEDHPAQIPERTSRGPRQARPRLLLNIALLAALSTSLVAGCTKRPQTQSPPRIDWSRIAVLPTATDDRSAALRNLAAAQIVARSLEGAHVARPILDLEALAHGRPGGDCLLDRAYAPSCLRNLFDAPVLMVSVQQDELAMGVQRRPGTQEEPLTRFPFETPVETLGYELVAALGLAEATIDSGDLEWPVDVTGTCFSSAALEPFAEALRARLSSTDEHNASTAMTASAVKLLEGILRDSPTPMVMSELARARYRAGAPEPLAVLESPLPRQCGLGHALLTRGELRLRLGDTTQAAVDLGLAARQLPFSPEALASWGRALVLVGRTEDAAQVLRRALALEPSHFGNRRRLAETLADLDKLEEARSVMIEGREFVHDQDSRATIELDLGWVAELDQNWRQAALHYERGVSLTTADSSPGLQSALYNGLGVAAINLKKWSEAETAFERAILLRRPLAEAGTREDRVLLANSLYNLGALYAETRSWDKAIASMTEAASFYGDEARLSTLLDLGRRLQLGGEPRRARNVLDSLGTSCADLLRHNVSKQAELTFLYGLVEARTGNLGSAMKRLELAARQFRGTGDLLDEGQAWFNLGIVAEQALQTQKAREAYSEAREVSMRLGDHESVLEIDERLQDLGR